MNQDEYLYNKLSEECAEVSQRVSKILCFGADEIQPKQDQTNMERLRFEVDDVLAMIRMLENARLLIRRSQEQLDEHFRYKAAKVEKYMQYSIQLGRMVFEEKEHS
jgi:hypothetical protein